MFKFIMQELWAELKLALIIYAVVLSGSWAAMTFIERSG